jgi:hypothetical protein
MNLVSVLVGVSIAGAAMPMVAQVSIQPFMAQKRASNLGVAEAKAVSYAAMNEGGLTLTPVPDGCTTVETENNAYSITCVEGENQFKQSVTRSFRLAVLCNDDDNDCSNSSGYSAPVSYTPGIFCPLWDAWGVINYNDAHNVQCIPVPYGPWAHTYNGPILW